MNHSNELSNVEKIKQLVDHLNLQRNAYYNENSPNISDAEYDRIFDELVELEKKMYLQDVLSLQQENLLILQGMKSTPRSLSLEQKPAVLSQKRQII